MKRITMKYSLPISFSGYLCVSLLFILVSSCGSKQKTESKIEESKALFTLLDPQKSGVNFSNPVRESVQFNYFNYLYIYAGGGVAAGDVNGDGLPDLFFTANMEPNRLYINQGNLHFKDATQSAGVAGKKGWSTGCAMLDVNDDGHLDIYVCYSGPFSPDQRRNELFINDGRGHFKESAAEYGLDDPGFSTQIYPFDYDMDGDMDLYLLSHRSDFKNSSSILAPRSDRGQDEYDTDKLFRNNGDGTFTNVTEKAGLVNRAYGLSALTMDFNGDGWTDIYVANDFVEPDMLYINDGKGHFRDACTEYLGHVSFNGMGSDGADINNDGLEDFYVLDMTPPEHKRSKQLMAAMAPEGFWNMIALGYQYQYMINTLQLNRGEGHFSEIAQLAGLDKTDWSWAPLFTDFDHDGLRDVFVSNGIKYDVTDNDFKIWLREKTAKEGPGLDFAEVMKKMPHSRVANYFMKNEGDYHFKKMNAEWKLNATQNSNGAAWADLDGDGDIDIICNNAEERASIYINHASENGNNFIKIGLEGPEGNRWGADARVEIRNGDEVRRENFRWVRGYQSSCEPLMHLGLGDHSQADEIRVRWHDGRETIVHNAKAGQTHLIRYADATNPAPQMPPEKWCRTDDGHGIDFQHREKAFDDYARELLIPHKESESGPKIAKGDANGDGFEDLFIGGAAGQAGALFLQDANGQFKEMSGPWQKDAAYEDMGALFFDADGDGDADLYLCSGSNEFEPNDPRYQDRLYLNNGRGQYTRAISALPMMHTSSAQAAAADWDADGDLDLFVGGQVEPGKYPFPPRSYLLENRNGHFVDVTEEIDPDLQRPGMITATLFADMDADGDPDLLIAGEWMPIRFFENKEGRFEEKNEPLAFEKSNGWWTALEAVDLEGDGDLDLVAGNTGENNKFHPTPEKPLHVYADDFDRNGSLDIVLSKTLGNHELVPVRGRQCSSEQMPFIKEKFPSYQSFATADLEEIYSPEELDSALHLEVYTMSSMVWINEGKGKFTQVILPREAQFSPLNGLFVEDLNGDGHPDIIAAGNRYGAEAETPRYDAGWGVILLGDGTGRFRSVPPSESGFYAGGNVQSLNGVYTGKKEKLLIITGVNKGKAGVFEFDLKKIAP